LDEFRQVFCERVHQRIAPEDRIAELSVDAESPLAQLTLRTVGQIEQLAPFGEENPRPLLCASGVTIFGQPKKMGGGDRHLSLQITQHNVTMRALAFGKGEWAEELADIDGPIDILYRPVINEFRGRRSVEVHLVDWRTASVGKPKTPHLATARPASLPF
jgi:single-stranded-DNA-specific exonuclease